jgi:hypothetical protein
VREEEDPAKRMKQLIRDGRLYLGIETEELTLPFAIKAVGNKPFLYSSDFPHEVTNESCKHDIGELMESGEIGEDDKAGMLWRNSETFYKLLPMISVRNVRRLEILNVQVVQIVPAVRTRWLADNKGIIMDTCRAAVITEHNKPLTIEQVPIPKLDPGSLAGKNHRLDALRHDVHRWHGPLSEGDTLPIITGHEPCGTVEDIAGERTDIFGNPVKRGDRIVWSYVACGSCYYCAVALQPCICPGRASWGHNRSDQHPYLLGSCAEYMYVPKECLIIKVPNEVTSASAAASACAYRTVMHGFDRLGAIKSHETVVIQGSGPLGNFATAVAKDHGAKKVLVIGAPGQSVGSDQTHGRGRRAQPRRGHR